MDGRAAVAAGGVVAWDKKVNEKLSVKLNRALCERARGVVQKAGYSSLEEFIEHAMERDLTRLEDADLKEELIRKLEGLGYLK